ncbi:GNAT family N-acetyltransferase [Vibrio sp. PP-XX7]
MIDLMRVAPLHLFKQSASVQHRHENMPVVLRTLTAQDAIFIYRYLTPPIARNLAIDPIQNYRAAQAFALGTYTTHKARFAMVHAQYGIIGSVHYGIESDASERSDADQYAEISYWVAAPFQRRGFTTQALHRLFTMVKAQGIRQATARAYLDNCPSQRLLQTVGFCLVGKRDLCGIRQVLIEFIGLIG